MHADPPLHSAAFWTSTATGALLVSLAAVVLFTCGLGAVFLPFEVKQTRREPCVSVTRCCLSADGETLVCVSRFLPYSSGWSHRLAAEDTARSGRMRQIFGGSIQPVSLAASPQGLKVFFVGDLDRS